MGRRNTICAVCGLAACVCLVAGEMVESAHPPLDNRPAVVATLPPSIPDHAHEQGPTRYVSIETDHAAQGGAGGAAASDVPPPSSSYLDAAQQVARRNFQRRYNYNPAYYDGSVGVVPTTIAG